MDETLGETVLKTVVMVVLALVIALILMASAGVHFAVPAMPTHTKAPAPPAKVGKTKDHEGQPTDAPSTQ